ncbi:DUF4007 family protein [Desulforhabdus sp. TSK]|uniref:DUF4007 family protein n=1 Tax=Desulforhabdus sp. TSK TaxID=2925014 RepID=UPI001FC7C60D|nr:DUF4007 family protein [Desulforhabdus sp. TSK]GKT08382.1 hypothetical protein DSTSK_16870 [Desulforhabdus sp. TSK]
MNLTKKFYSFSGHETFPLRVAWLPKAVAAVSRGQDPFSNPRNGMRILGLGKNMVTALQCWSEYFGVIERAEGRLKVTEFGEIIFGASGTDPFLEDRRTLWLLHWQASTNTSGTFFAWHWIVNLCQEPEFAMSEALEAFQAESDAYARPLSLVTLRQHLDVFLRTYVASERMGNQIPEDTLDSPLSSLGFIRRLGERRGERGRDPLFLIDVRRKNSISNDLFRFCLHDWWNRFAKHEETVLFSDVAFGRCSPGRVFRMPETEIRDRLAHLSQEKPDEFIVLEGANQRMIRRLSPTNDLNMLLPEAFGRHA